MLIGAEVNESNVKEAFPQFADQTITPVILSQAAMLQMTTPVAGGKSPQESAIDTLNAFKDEYGMGTSALVMIYNASGEDLTLKTKYDWQGQMGKYPVDPIIANGQYSVFLHVHYGYFFGTSCGLVFKGESEDDFLMLWYIPYVGANSVYVDVEAQGFWETQKALDDSYEKANDITSSSQKDHFLITASISERETSPIVTFIVERSS